MGGVDLSPALLADLAALGGPAASEAAERLEHRVVVDGLPTPFAGPVCDRLIEALRSGVLGTSAGRVEVLYLLGQIAEATVGSPGVAPSIAVLACRTRLPAILAVAEQIGDDPDSDVRVEAADTAEAAQEVLDLLAD